MLIGIPFRGLWGLKMREGGLSLIRRCSRHLGRSPSHEEVAEWACENVRMSVKRGSWAVYRSSHLSMIDDEDLKLSVSKIYAEKGRNKGGERREKMPSKRRKDLSEKDLSKLVSELKRGKYPQWGKGAIIWLIAGVNSGLRPGEWRQSEIVKVNNKNHIRVKNSKLINFDSSSVDAVDMDGRNRTLYRNVPIHHLPENTQQLISVQSQTSRAMMEKGLHDAFYAGVRKTINRAAHSVWPEEKKAVSLYTARHAYKDRVWSQLGKMGLSTPQIEVITAVLMGQGSKKTQYAYGVGDEDSGHQEEIMAIESLDGEAKIMLGEAISSVVN
jgi:hypothetical protein